MTRRDQQQSSAPSTAHLSPPPGTPFPYADSPGAEGIDLLELWRGVVDHKKLVVLITGMVTALAAVAAWVITPMYRAEVLLAPVRQDKAGVSAALAGQFGGLAELTGINLGESGNDVAKAVATLKSRALTNTFIEEENLMPILFSRKWDPERQGWKVGDEKRIPTLWKAFEFFDKKIRTVTENKKTGLITLSIAWKSPTLAAEWANQLVKRVNARLRDDAIREAGKSIAYLKQELRKTNVVEVEQAIYRLIEAQTKNIMVANAREEYAFTVIDPAVPPEKQAKPKRALMIILGFMLGLTMAIFTVFIRTAIAKQRNGQRAYIREPDAVTDVIVQEVELDAGGADEGAIARRGGAP